MAHGRRVHSVHRAGCAECLMGFGVPVGFPICDDFHSQCGRFQIGGSVPEKIFKKCNKLSS